MVDREMRLSGTSPAAASMAMRLCTGGTGAEVSGPRSACGRERGQESRRVTAVTDKPATQDRNGLVRTRVQWAGASLQARTRAQGVTWRGLERAVWAWPIAIPYPCQVLRVVAVAVVSVVQCRRVARQEASRNAGHARGGGRYALLVLQNNTT